MVTNDRYANCYLILLEIISNDPQFGDFMSFLRISYLKGLCKSGLVVNLVWHWYCMEAKFLVGFVPNHDYCDTLIWIMADICK